MNKIKNTQRHSELVSESPSLQGIAGQARNDEKRKNLANPENLMKIMVQDKRISKLNKIINYKINTNGKL